MITEDYDCRDIQNLFVSNEKDNTKTNIFATKYSQFITN